MTILERIANRLGLVSRRQFRAAIANFQTAAVNRLTAHWTQTTLSPDAQTRMDLSTLRARCRELRDNNDYGSKFLSMVKTNVCGEAGIHFQSRVKDADRVIAGELIPGKLDVFANKVIEDEWWKWGRRETCTVSGTMSWCDVQRVVIESVATDGEHIIRLARGVDNPYSFALRLYEAEMIDETMNEMRPNGNEVRMGVEINSLHKPVAYWMWTSNPSDTFYFRSAKYTRERVPAEEVIHLGVIRRACQTRFVPWMSTSGFRMNMVGKYEESEHIASRIAASKMGFFTTEGGQQEYTGDTDSDGNKITDVEPGNFEKLPNGWKVNTVDWQHPNTAYQSFMKTALRGIAAGLNVSYNSLANDMESVNFASGKLGLMEEREVWKALQRWFIESFHERVFAEWLKMALTTQAVPLPLVKFDKFNAPVFRGRRWTYVNPAQEVDADIRQINAGLTSVSRVLAERNIDRDELFDEIEDDRRAMDARGIRLIELEPKAAPAPNTNQLTEAESEEESDVK